MIVAVALIVAVIVTTGQRIGFVAIGLVCLIAAAVGAPAKG